MTSPSLARQSGTLTTCQTTPSVLTTLSRDTFLWPTLPGALKIRNISCIVQTTFIFRTRHAVIIEPLRPERFFIRTFNSTSLYILSVCEVDSKIIVTINSQLILPPGLWLLPVPLLSILQSGQHISSPLDSSSTVSSDHIDIQ